MGSATLLESTTSNDGSDKSLSSGNKKTSKEMAENEDKRKKRASPPKADSEESLGNNKKSKEMVENEDKRKKRASPPKADSEESLGDKKKGKEKAENEDKGKKRASSPKDGNEESLGTRKMPRRAAACKSFKEKSVSISSKDSLVVSKKEMVAQEEILAMCMTGGGGDGRNNRRLSDFTLHDGSGVSQPPEMLEVCDIFISGFILPLEESSDKEKERGVKCEGFGRIESWDISGYEDGYAIIWISTEVADYHCLKPAASYKKYYDLFFEKARACVEVYKQVSKCSQGSLGLSLDELLAGVIRSMNAGKSNLSGASIKDFIISQGEFIYSQLISLETSKSDIVFANMTVLDALRDECTRLEFRQPMAISTGGVLKIGSGVGDGESTKVPSDDDENTKLAKLLQEEEYWQSMKQKKGRALTAGSSKYYVKINEDEIANDYPLPAYYKSSAEETDEFVIFDNEFDMCYPNELPRSMLHNWSLYNSDLRLVSLELLPMKPCADIDVTIFGSGIMTSDDGSGFCLDDDLDQSSGGSQTQNTDGMPIYLSAIKEWMIEFGSSMVFISIRTDMAWYRLGKPSKQYAPWYETVLKTAKLGISIITLLKEQSRISRLSFMDVIKKLLEFKKDHRAYISSNQAIVERYVVVHGQIILQLFAEFPDDIIKKCAFVGGLSNKMEERHHTKWLVKKKKVDQKSGLNMNPRAAMGPTVSKRKVMQATTTRLINRIWGEYYSNYSPEEQENKESPIEAKEEDEVDEQEENEDDDPEEDLADKEKLEGKSPSSIPKKPKTSSVKKETAWEGKPVGKTSSGEDLYERAVLRGEGISVGSSVLMEDEDSDELPIIYLVEYMFEASDGSKMIHGRLMQRGSHTVLGNTANEREVFLTNDCLDVRLEDVIQSVVVDITLMPWGHEHRKANANADKIDRAKAEERKKKGLPMEYYCKSMYLPEKGAFVSLSRDTIGLGSGSCASCKRNEAEKEKTAFRVDSSKTNFVYDGINYSVNDFVYASPQYFAEEKAENGTFKGGRNVGLKAYVVCQVLEIIVKKGAKKAEIKSTEVKVRRFYRPEDISAEKAYTSDIREVYYSEETECLPVDSLEGKCEVKKQIDVPLGFSAPSIYEHIFFCERMYDPAKGSLKQMPAHIKLLYSTGSNDIAASRKKKGKGKEGESNIETEKQKEASQHKGLSTLDIFAGCGGLSEGLQHAGAAVTKWAIEYEQPAGDAFKFNHPDASVFVDNCNVILSAVMGKCGDTDDCISTPEATDLAASLDEKVISDLPMPGQVDFINGGPPCQGFSGMNRFNQSTWSKVQCEMILAFLSFADYFRPKYFLLENVRNFVSFNKGQTFRLTVASLLEMGYQVRFGILEAGTFGVSQSRKRAFIWAASPDEVLPEWPEPMHVFSAPELKITLSGNSQYAAAKSTANGAPFRAMTVRDSIGDLPPVGNGACRNMMEYQYEPVSWFQKHIRGNMVALNDHISKEMNELNFIRCQRIPKRAGADWHDLPDEKVKLSNGQMADLIPWCLPNTAKRHNQWKGLFGRLDWEGNFPTSITDPQPMGKVGMCFHPEQDRILTVRECARSQGFPDSYVFSGNILHKHRQIGNAVPPPLAFALGWKLKEAIDKNKSCQ